MWYKQKNSKQDYFFGILTILICLNAISKLGNCNNNDKSKQTSENNFEFLCWIFFPTVTKSLPFSFPWYSKAVWWTSTHLFTAMSTTEKACTEFRTISMLLPLVTTIRNDGQPVMHTSFSEGFKPMFDHSLPSLEVVSSAVTSILIQNHKVVACMARDRTHLMPSDPQIRRSDSALKLWLKEWAFKKN